MMNPEISIQTVLPPYEKILPAAICYLVYLRFTENRRSVKVYLHTGAKVRHDRLHVVAADAQRSRWNRRRVVDKLGGIRRENLRAAIERDPGLRKVGYRPLSTRDRSRRSAR